MTFDRADRAVANGSRFFTDEFVISQKQGFFLFGGKTLQVCFIIARTGRLPNAAFQA
ncbi:MAG TPA: hypothetical protein VFI93_11890 [Rhizomicrobium sp.]|nr:hypothetical protein [Rhizomicrobium sp.]